MADLRQRLLTGWNELKRWLVAGRALWAVIATLVVLYLVTYNFPAEKLLPDRFKDGGAEFADRVRWFGILLEVVSISTIAYGVSQSMAAFSKPKLVARFFRWVAEIRYVLIRRPPIHAIAHGVSLGLVTSVATGTVLIKAGTMEQQLDQLRQAMDAVKKSIGDVNERVGQIERNTKKWIEDESAERQLTDRRLGDLIEHQKIGDVHIQIAGLALLLISIFMANAPTESSMLLRFLGLGHRAYW
jgi:hypothetical protein